MGMMAFLVYLVLQDLKGFQVALGLQDLQVPQECLGSMV
jgi:hypothetical protein